MGRFPGTAGVCARVSSSPLLPTPCCRALSKGARVGGKNPAARGAGAEDGGQGPPSPHQPHPPSVSAPLFICLCVSGHSSVSRSLSGGKGD